MISLVQRVPSDDDHVALERGASLIDSGAHFTFLQGGDLMARWSKPLLRPVS